MNTSRKLSVAVLIVAGLLIGSTLPSVAEESYIAVGGRLSDLGNEPLEGYRVVYRHVTEVQVFISVPSDESGEYLVSLPENDGFRPIAVITPTGKRVLLQDQRLVRAVPGARRDIRLEGAFATVSPSDIVQYFPGSDRLMLAFVEDATLVRQQRWEFQAEVANFDDADLTVSRVIGVFQLERLAGVEFGAALGLGTLDTSVSDDSGLTDLDAWFKFDVINRDNGSMDLSVGTRVTLPIGDDDSGVGQDGLRSEFFGALRRQIRWGTFSAHAGIWLNQDGVVRGVPRNGEIAPTAGAALLVPVSADVVLFGEVRVEGERFEGDDTDARLLAGANWRLLELLTLRIGLGFGLTDGAPDSQFLVGFSTDF